MGFWDDITGKTGADAAKAAAADKYGKERQAIDASREAGNTYLAGLMQTSRAYDPFVQGGQSAYQRLLQGLGLQPGGTEAFTAAYRGLPGYQSGMDAGSKAVTARLNAGPGMQSGAAMKALQRYGSDYEDQRVGDYLNRLAGVGTQGLAATQGQTGLQAQGYGGQMQGNLNAANQMYGSAGTIGQGDVAAAQSRSAGTGNLMNLGMQGIGMLMGMPGGFGSSFGSSGGSFYGKPASNAPVGYGNFTY